MPPEPPQTALLAAVVAIATFGSFAWGAWIVAVAGVDSGADAGGRRGELSSRWSAAFATFAWGLTVLFFALVSSGAFHRGIAVALSLATAAILHRKLDGRGAARRLRTDLAAAGSLVTEAIRSSRARPAPGTDRIGVLDLALLAAGACVVVVRLGFELTSPPMAWDSMTYHLLRAGRWAATGGWATESAPDAWGYYEFHSVAGDAMWAWAMLPFRSDAITGLAGFGCWGGMFLAVHALARAAGARGASAFRWAAVSAFAPAALNQAVAGYVDVFASAMFVAGMAHLARAVGLDADEGTEEAGTSGEVVRGRPRRGHAVFAAVALATAAAAKFTLLPALALGMGVLVVATFSSESSNPARAPRLRPSTLGCALAVAAAATLPWMIRGLVLRGSPFYPFVLPIPGFDALPGDLQMLRLYSGSYLSEDSIPPFGEQLRTLLYEWAVPVGWSGGAEHWNFGPAVPLVAAFGLLGAIVLARRGRGTVRAAFLLALGLALAIPVAGLLSPDMTAHRIFWARSSGRLVLATHAGLCALAALHPRAAVPGRIALACGVALCIPPPIPREVRVATIPAVGAILLAGALVVLLFRFRQGRRATILRVAALACGIAILAALPTWRARLRYPLWKAEVARLSERNPRHPLVGLLGAWPVWKALDGPEPRRIAASAGWWPFGHSWFRYPLLGSRLQNTVVWISPFRGDEVLDYLDHPRPDATMDFETWHARLLASGAEVFVAMHPDPPEGAWLRARPDLFHPIAHAEHGTTTAYRIERPRGDRAVDRTGVRASDAAEGSSEPQADDTASR